MTNNLPAFGPYENERQTYTEPMPQAVRQLHDTGQVRSGDPDRIVRDTVAGHLLRACDDAGVDLGAYDRRVLLSLSVGEKSTAQVLIGLISRAYAAGRAAGPAHVTTVTPAPEPGPGDDWLGDGFSSTWTCTCGDGSDRPLATSMIERQAREHEEQAGDAR